MSKNLSTLDMLVLCCSLLLFSLTRGIIQIKQGATTRNIELASPYSSLKQFRGELMGKNGYHNLNFERITSEEIGHLPKDLFLKLNERQVRQILECYKTELAKGHNPISYTKALHHLFASKQAIKLKQVDFLDNQDIDAIGFNPDVLPIASLPKKLLSHLISRWSVKKMSAVVKKELQSLNLEELVKNKSLTVASPKKTFFENLHSQQTIEHWPRSLKQLSKRAGASESSLNRKLGVSRTGSSYSDSDSKTDPQSSSESQDTSDADSYNEPARRNRNSSSRQAGRPPMQTINQALMRRLPKGEPRRKEPRRRRGRGGGGGWR